MTITTVINAGASHKAYLNAQQGRLETRIGFKDLFLSSTSN